MPSTTSLIVELLVVGACASSWVYLFLSTITGTPVIVSLGGSNLLPLLASLYILGVITNFLADQMCQPIDKRIAHHYGGKKAIQRARTSVLANTKEAGTYLMQRRSIVRIFRASLLNVVMITLAVVLNISNIREKYQINYLPALLVLTILFLICLWGYVKTLSGYYAFVSTAEEVAHEAN